MEQLKVDMYMMTNQKYFPAEKLHYIRERLTMLDDSRFPVLTAVDLKDPTAIQLVSVYVGGLGIDRFMLGDIGMGVLKLLTCGCCGVLTIIDWFTISGKAKEINFTNIMNLLQ